MAGEIMEQGFTGEIGLGIPQPQLPDGGYEPDELPVFCSKCSRDITDEGQIYRQDGRVLCVKCYEEEEGLDA